MKKDYRLRDISEETANQQQPRRRSNSLPIPKIEVSIFQNDSKKQETKDFIEVPEVKDVSPLAGIQIPNTTMCFFTFKQNLGPKFSIVCLESPYHHRKPNHEHVRRSSEKAKKSKMKMADLKAFVETRLLSKSDKALEKIGQDEPKLLGEQAVGARHMFSVCTLSSSALHFLRFC